MERLIKLNKKNIDLITYYFINPNVMSSSKYDNDCYIIKQPVTIDEFRKEIDLLKEEIANLKNEVSKVVNTSLLILKAVQAIKGEITLLNSKDKSSGFFGDELMGPGGIHEEIPVLPAEPVFPAQGDGGGHGHRWNLRAKRALLTEVVRRAGYGTLDKIK